MDRRYTLPVTLPGIFVRSDLLAAHVFVDGSGAVIPTALWSAGKTGGKLTRISAPGILGAFVCKRTLSCEGGYER